jgi:UDP-N-acetylglucosamine:LPS N-acetylglucosamine transferase
MTDQSQPAASARRIAFFISPHGFGHAARAASIMDALIAIDPVFHFDIFTTVPDWFFRQCRSFTFTYHRLLTDIGIVQQTPFRADLAATIRALKRFLPFDPAQIASRAEQLRQQNCELVVCDISPLGIRTAKKANLPSVLIENFTWPWLYQGYIDKRLNEFNGYLQAAFADANYHIQTQPVCHSANADFVAAPASRKVKIPSGLIRRRLGLPDSCKVVIITAGGTPKNYSFIDTLKQVTDIHFIVPGAADSESMSDNLILLPENSAYFHPDLINAADAVVGKVGYSTIAEIFQTGVPFGYVTRPDNREMQPLVDFIENQMRGMAIAELEFNNGAFTEHLEALFKIPRSTLKRPNGADQIAGFIAALLK